MAVQQFGKGLFPLLVASGRTQLAGDDVQMLRDCVTEDVHWPSLTRDAQLHGVLPLLARNLSRYADDLVPPAQLETLRNLYTAQGARNSLILRTLVHASNQLFLAGIPAIAIKGPTLAQRAYGNLSLRQFSDLDFLIRPADISSVVDVLNTAGYRHQRTGQNWRYVKFVSPEGFLLDLQWGLGPEWFRFPLDLDSVWSRAEDCDFDGGRVLTLPDHDTLMLLCGHATKHCWSKLGWLVDLNEYVLRRGRFLEWDALVRQAQSLGGLRMLLLGLALTRDILGTQVPEQVRHLLDNDRTVSSLSRTVQAKLAVSGDVLAGGEGAFNRSESHRFHLAARERIRDRMPYAKHLLASKLDWRPTANRLMRAGKRLSRSANS